MCKPLTSSVSVLLIILFVITLSGCATHSRSSVSTTSAAIADKNQKAGIMTSADYLHWEQVSNKVATTRRIDDADLDWAISMMQKPSTNPPEVHSLMMGLFLTLRTATPLQQNKIRDAVTPLLASTDKYDPKWAKAVLKKFPE